MKSADFILRQLHHVSSDPLIVTFLRVYRENRQAILDFIGLLALSTFTFILLSVSDFTETFFEFTRAHEEYQLDEMLLLATIVLAIYLPIFTIRRWIEAVQ